MEPGDGGEHREGEARGMHLDQEKQASVMQKAEETSKIL